MIDYFALALGHGLMAIALLHLVMREGVDVDPLIDSIKDALKQKRLDASVAGRNVARRKKTERQAQDNLGRSSSVSGSADKNS